MASEEEIMTQLRIDVVRLEAKLEKAEIALSLSREALEKRLDYNNHTKEEIKERIATFVTRDELRLVVTTNRSELWTLVTTAMFLTIGIISLFQKFFGGALSR